jgi:hypothetical protein
VAVNVSTAVDLEQLLLHPSSSGLTTASSSSSAAAVTTTLRFTVSDVYNASVADVTVSAEGELRAVLGPQDSALFLLTPV